MTEPRDMLVEAKAKLADARNAVKDWERIVDALESVVGDASKKSPKTAHGTSVEDGTLAGASTTRAIKTVFKNRGAVAMHVMDLVEEAQRLGYRPDLSKEKVRTYFVSLMVRRPDLFKRTDKGVYALVK